VPDQWILDSNAQWTGAVYQWLHDFVKEEFIGMHAPHTCYDLMEEKARTAPPGSNDTYAFLGSVIMDVRNFFVLRPGVFFFPPPTHPMVERPTTLGHLIRATLENIVYAIQGNIGHLARIYGKAFSRELHITGGLSQSRLFVEILAGCTGMPVTVSKYREGTSLGAAICASVGIGLYPDLVEAARHMVQLEESVEPVPDHTSLYRKGYERWRDLYTAIADL
jgi:autoinducer 2 (AI-2) kinase